MLFSYDIYLDRRAAELALSRVEQFESMISASPAPAFLYFVEFFGLAARAAGRPTATAVHLCSSCMVMYGAKKIMSRLSCAWCRRGGTHKRTNAMSAAQRCPEIEIWEAQLNRVMKQGPEQSQQQPDRYWRPQPEATWE